MRAKAGIRAWAMTMAALTFAFAASACGTLTGLDQDFHETDCFAGTGCADGANDSTLTEQADVAEGSDPSEEMQGDANLITDGTMGGDAADAGSESGKPEAYDAIPDRVVMASADGGFADGGPANGRQEAGAAMPDTGIDAGVCGNGFLDLGEHCDQGSANAPIASAYGMKGACTTLCTFAPYCGDGIVNGPEACDKGGSGATALGACNPECTGFYTKKVISHTTAVYNGNLGGVSGADNICQNEFGAAWKAFLVGGRRRATFTPYTGDNTQDWVLQKYTYYYNAQDQLIWRTDAVPLLGVSGGAQQAVSAAVFDAGIGAYAWSGWSNDWTTVQDIAANASGTCSGWTSSSDWGQFITPSLVTANDGCNTMYFVLCVQQ